MHGYFSKKNLYFYLLASYIFHNCEKNTKLVNRNIDFFIFKVKSFYFFIYHKMLLIAMWITQYVSLSLSHFFSNKALHEIRIQLLRRILLVSKKEIVTFAIKRR